MTQWAVYTGRQQGTFGVAPDYAAFASDGTLTLAGNATAFEDLRQDVTGTRNGVVTPTTGVGFRGDNNVYHTTLVNTQADEVQFEVQLPHAGLEGSVLFPHVHFAPTAAGSANNAARFVLAYRWANVDAQFAADEQTYTMTKTWAGDKSWYHLIANNATGLTLTGWTLSSILKCRLYRDNTVTNNLAAAVSFLYFDIHVEINSLGSSQEYTK